jgi:hypothetical protein
MFFYPRSRTGCDSIADQGMYLVEAKLVHARRRP